ncbi:MAG: ferredoxin family protein [Acidobacteriota bacterium]
MTQQTTDSKEAQEAPKEVAPQQEAAPNGKPKKSFHIDIFRDWCKACGICSAFCPRHCISVNEDGIPQVDQPENCSGCGWCEVHCPDFAISVRQAGKDADRCASDEAGD